MKIEKSLLTFLNDIMVKTNKKTIVQLDEFMDVNNDKILNDFYKCQHKEIDLSSHNFDHYYHEGMQGVLYCVEEFITQPDISYEYRLLGTIICYCINMEQYDIMELMKHRWATLYVINCIISTSIEDLVGKNSNIHHDICVSISSAICALKHHYKQEYKELKYYYKKMLL